MTGILLRCLCNYRLLHKKATCNETKTMINFVTWRSNKRFFRSQRDLSTIINAQNVTEPELLDKLFIANDYIKMHHFLLKKHVDSIINLIDNKDSVSRDQVYLLLEWCNVVIDCLPSEKVELMKSMWTILTACNFKKYIEHYNVRLRIYIENEYDFSPPNIITEMNNDGLLPNRFIHLMCMKHYCMKGDVDEALALMKRTKLQYSSTESVYNLLMLGYSQSGNVQRLNNLISIMKEEGIMLTNESYAPVLYAYAKMNNILEILKIIERCNSDYIHFTNKQILDIIYILARNKRTKYIDTMFRHLRKRQLVLPSEINIILKLANCSETGVAVAALSLISSDDKCSQFKNIIELILKQAVNNSRVIDHVSILCMTSQSNLMFKKLLSTTLCYALQKGSESCLPLLKTYKYYSQIKPHFFWPLLVREGDQYNIQGIFNILEIMMSYFNVDPCVDTIADYVLPFTFGSEFQKLKVLRKCKIPEVTIHNAYVKVLLRRKKLKLAVTYIHAHNAKYYYKHLAYDLRQAFLQISNIDSFVDITCNLVEGRKRNSAQECIDKQLRDFMIDFPGCKTNLLKILKHLGSVNVSLSNETVSMIMFFLYGYRTREVTNVLQLLTNKKK